MSFDPYHKWLGIPQGERPPHHYSLLGIPLFESDDEVISYAADRQMLHLRSLAHGPHGNLSQRLLNEISLAKCCLLDPRERAEYDAQLRQLLQAMAPPLVGQAPASPRVAASLPVTDTLPESRAFEAPSVAALDLAIAPRIMAIRRTRPRHSRIGRCLPWLLPLFAAGGLVAFVWYAKNEFARHDAEPTHPMPTATERAADPPLNELPRNPSQPRDGRSPRGFVPTQQLLPRDAADESGEERSRPDPMNPVAERAGEE